MRCVTGAGRVCETAAHDYMNKSNTLCGWCWQEKSQGSEARGARMLLLGSSSGSRKGGSLVEASKGG